jgi:hypothetical protein
VFEIALNSTSATIQAGMSAVIGQRSAPLRASSRWSIDQTVSHSLGAAALPAGVYGCRASSTSAFPPAQISSFGEASEILGLRSEDEMSRITAAPINGIAQTSSAPVYLLHFWGTEKNPVFGLLNGSVRRISALGERFRLCLSWLGGKNYGEVAPQAGHAGNEQ